MVLAEKMKRLPLEDVERFMNNTPVLIDVEGCMIKRGRRERDFIIGVCDCLILLCLCGCKKNVRQN
jgi:hypothetical protein